MKPTIAILPLIDLEQKSYWMLPGYMDGILDAGGIPVMLPWTLDDDLLEYFADTYDGFLFPGGQDVSPSMYEEERSERCGEICPKLDEMTSRLFEMVLEADKPILGICRGLQILNVLFGGTLYQDLSEERPDCPGHKMDAPYDRSAHLVSVEKETPLYDLLSQPVIGVNSCHHQAIRTLAGGLTPMAHSEDGLTEAFYRPDSRFLWAVQWHPEMYFKADENSRKILRAFVESC
ncbi:MAG: gamma-glutamyl-gamma-aminobutyrate hydrolase family protein [Eubacteriales bacterium]|nr:gamma-glutamyl-gamma-aminobutyrate hydrolase family protein [Eubacteriales bacterium]